MALFPCWPHTKIPVMQARSQGRDNRPRDHNRVVGVYPAANIAVATGSKSGVFVFDIDMKHEKDGEAELRALEAKHGALPKTVESITPSGGRHLWFRMPEQPSATAQTRSPRVSTSVVTAATCWFRLRMSSRTMAQALIPGVLTPRPSLPMRRSG